MSSRTYVKIEAKDIVNILKKGNDLVWMKDVNAWNIKRNLGGYIKDDKEIMMYTNIIDDDHIETSCRFGIDERFASGIFHKYKINKLTVEIDDTEYMIDGMPLHESMDDPQVVEYLKQYENEILKYKITYEIGGSNE